MTKVEPNLGTPEREPIHDIHALFSAYEADRFELHSRHLNNMMVRVLKTIGFDVRFVSGKGAHLVDASGARYLDLLSGFGVFQIGRNHPRVAEALKSVLDSDLPNLVQMDVSVLAGVLAERLLAYAPWLQKVFFANSGSEAFEAAVKFARAVTGRPGIVHCEHSFHGLTYGALSANGDEIFRGGFGPLLPGFVAIPFDDLPALERALSRRDVAALCVEPIQGKGVNMPSSDYLRTAHDLCRKYGTLFVADEIQTGLGRTGPFLRCRALGRGARYDPDRQGTLGRACSGRGRPASKAGFRKGFRPHGQGGRSWIDVRQE